MFYTAFRLNNDVEQFTLDYYVVLNVYKLENLTASTEEAAKVKELEVRVAFLRWNIIAEAANDEIAGATLKKAWVGA